MPEAAQAGPYFDMTGGVQYTRDLDNTKAWEFQFIITDKFGSNTYSMMLPKGQPILFFDTNKISIGINTFPSGNNSFETTNLSASGTANFSGAATFNSAVNINSTLNLNTAARNSILNYVYPVGSIFMSASSTNPSSYFGGTWSLWGSGKVPVCVNTSDSDFSPSKKTGGSKTHRHLGESECIGFAEPPRVKKPEPEHKDILVS